MTERQRHRDRDRKTELVNVNPVNHTGSPQDKTNGETDRDRERQS